MPTPLAPSAPRVPSVDALRALVMFTMLYVNDVAGVGGIPWWMKHHHPDDGNGMTFVDLVFPAFLFLVGMSIPLALQNRLARGEPAWRLVRHTLVRGLSLLLIGVFMVNMETIGTKYIGWPRGLWQALSFVAVLLAFHAVPLKSTAAKWASVAVRLVGFGTLAYLATVYRDKHDHLMQPQWWGILGLIGFAYVISTLIYLPLRRCRMTLLVAALALLVVWVFGDKWGWLDWLPFGDYLGGTTIGSQPAITLFGVVLATTFAGPDPIRVTRDRLLFAAGLIAAAVLGAFLTYDAYGINKNNATPAWCLWSVAITAALWIPFHLLLDLKPTPPRIARVTTHLGANVLMAYMLSPLIHYLLQLAHVEFYGRLGATPSTGIPRSLIWAAIILSFSGLMDRLRIRLKV